MGGPSSQTMICSVVENNLSRLEAAVKSRKLYPAGELGVHMLVTLD